MHLATTEIRRLARERGLSLSAFLKSRGLAADVVQSPNFFTTMVEAVQKPSSTGLTWCNDNPRQLVCVHDGHAPVTQDGCRGGFAHADAAG